MHFKHLLPESRQREDILLKYAQQVEFEQLEALRARRWERLLREHWQPLRAMLSQLPDRERLSNRGEYSVDTSKAAIRFGDATSLTNEELQTLTQVLHQLIPWRKGPFSVCGIEVDAEWRSDWKWDRMVGTLPDLRGKLVADVGCSNGYYMMRALEHQPAGILGIDPSEKFLFAFELFQRFGHFSQLQYELLGIEEMHLFRELFDVVLCCGILYHHRNPLHLLNVLHSSMRSGATLIVESQAIPGDEPVALCPKDRYAKARNVYFIPTASCVASWLSKSGFREIEVCSAIPLTIDEQRRTEWMHFESLEDFLDPDNRERTIEGFPAPWRVIVRAIK